MSVHKVKGGKGYQFGTHGKVYSTKEQAKQQQTAIHASGYGMVKRECPSLQGCEYVKDKYNPRIEFKIVTIE